MSQATRLTLPTLALLALLGAAGVARAEHFDISLNVTASGNETHASWDTEPPQGGVNPRPVAQARAGETIHVDWVMRSAYPHATMKQVNVHFFVVPEDALAQKAVPDKAVPRLVDSAFAIDFRPDYAAKGS